MHRYLRMSSIQLNNIWAVASPIYLPVDYATRHFTIKEPRNLGIDVSVEHKLANQRNLRLWVLTLFSQAEKGFH